MKTLLKLSTLFLLVITACKKDSAINVNAPSNTDNYSSINDFFIKNGVTMQSYTVNGSTGGSFASPQGTTVTIPANAFLTQSSIPVTGNVIIQFKDIYKKSDMLLSNMPTMNYFGSPLKSGGEFFIRAISNNSALILASGKKISVNQPASLTGGIDTVNIQQPFIQQDSLGSPIGWGPTSIDSINYAASSYIFSLYQFKFPVDSGSWCNSDNSSYFFTYNQTTLTLSPTDNISTYNTQVFLMFKNISSMVHVYSNGINFPYNYAPQGLQCTAIGVGVKAGKLYASFIPITIGSNQTVNFSLNQTTTANFLIQLKALN